MPDIRFSMPDLFLIVTIIECVLTFCLVVIARAVPAPSRLCRNVLGALFIAIALDALSMLLIWHGGIRQALADFSGVSIVVATLAMASKGPLLYLFMCTLTRPNYALQKHHLWHLAPLVSALVLVAIYQLDTSKLTLPIEANVDNWGTYYWWTILRLAPTIYAIFALMALHAMAALYDSHYAGGEYGYSYWIKLLAFGFLIQWCMALTTHILGQHFPSGMTNIMGKVNDFLGLLLVNGLLVYAFTLMRTLTPILGDDTPELSEQDSPINSDSAQPVTTIDLHASTALPDSAYRPKVQSAQVNTGEHAVLAAISTGIYERKLYLHPTLNLDKFASALELSSKEVSRVINTYYHCSFSEFINAYRTLEAEQLLSDPAHQETPVVDIIRLPGFNSKSAFHRFFKRFTGVSPSEYRARIGVEV